MFGFLAFEQSIEAIEAALPLIAERLQPLVHMFEWAADDEGPRTALRVAPLPYEASVFEHAEVLRDSGLSQAERPRELGHRRLSLREAREQRPTGGIGEGREHLVETGFGFVHCHIAI